MRKPIAAAVAVSLAALVAGCGEESGSSPPPLESRGQQDARADGGESRERSGGVPGDALAGDEPEGGREERGRDAGDDRGRDAGDDRGRDAREGSGRSRDGRGSTAGGRRSDSRGADAPRRGRSPNRTPSPEAVAEVDRARATVRQLIAGLRRGDARVCDRLMTRRYVEQITERRGAGAVRQCRHDVSQARLDASVEAFGPSELNERQCVVRARIRIGDHRYAHVYVLRKTRGAWLLDERVETRRID